MPPDDSTEFPDGATRIVPADEFSKEQRDVAFAAALLSLGVVGERPFAAALSKWSIHGSVPLSEHLVEQGLLDRETCDRVEAEGFRRLFDRGSGPSTRSTAGESHILRTIEALDGSGRLSRLLGLRGASGLGAEADSARAATCRYDLVRRIGQGGLGRVWLAFDEDLKRYVAVKELSERGQEADLERFRREAEITGRLEHPGIVPVYHLGRDERTGNAFYAMRFLGKRTLQDEIDEYHERRAAGDDDPMLIRRLLTAFVSVCQAIGHAHSRKVIHRDLKPENVAIDSFGQVIVIDWGLAKVVDETGVGEIGIDPSRTVAGSEGSTLDGQVLGTPLYMAPEQAAGRIDDLDERTDIYGLGAILFAILAGRPPHDLTRDAVGAAGTRDLIAAIAREPTPQARRANADVDSALDAICARAMAKRPYARYESASDLAEEIQRWMAGEPVTACRESFRTRAARWVRNHAVWSQVIAAAAIVVFVGVATFGVAARQSHLAERQIRFDQMRGRAHEVELQLVRTAEDLQEDVRFMSTLPPIQALVDATRKRENEGIDVWRDRLETIYVGLLRANSDYLSITFAPSDPPAAALARVERFRSDAGYVRRVPVSRLGLFARDELRQRAEALPPGEVALQIVRDDGAGESAGRGISLAAAIPVYDEVGGDPFGVVVLESNLTRQIADILERLDVDDIDVAVGDEQGRPWVSKGGDSSSVVHHAAGAADGPVDVPAPLAAFFGDAERRRLLDRHDGLVAERVHLAPFDSSVAVTIVVRFAAED